MPSEIARFPECQSGLSTGGWHAGSNPGFACVRKALLAGSVASTYSTSYMGFFSSNIGTAGRIVRGACGLGCAVGAWFLRDLPVPAVALAGSGVFMLFEAFKGWCVARACGLKTPL